MIGDLKILKLPENMATIANTAPKNRWWVDNIMAHVRAEKRTCLVCKVVEILGQISVCHMF